MGEPLALPLSDCLLFFLLKLFFPAPGISKLPFAIMLSLGGILSGSNFALFSLVLMCIVAGGKLVLAAFDECGLVSPVLLFPISWNLRAKASTI